jgi:hypothetical protein
MDLRSKRWGQIADEALLRFRITTDNLTPGTPPPTMRIRSTRWWAMPTLLA